MHASRRQSECAPYLLKILHMPGEVDFYDVYLYRQVFTDDESLEAFANPSWMGYSVGKWVGDDFVVETGGVNEKF